jgi:hypothetical protein
MKISAPSTTDGADIRRSVAVNLSDEQLMLWLETLGVDVLSQVEGENAFVDSAVQFPDLFLALT